MVEPQTRAPGLSVIIPTYNSAPWLPSTLDALAVALAKTSWKAEVVIVDDGSTDDTAGVITQIAQNFSYPVRVISQANQGRFMARWNGAQNAQYSTMLLLDSRIPLGEDSLAFVEQHSPGGLNFHAWNGHAVTDPSAALIGHFWEVPTYVFWGSYLSNPQRTIIESRNFNKVPKGTTFFICPTELFIECSHEHWPDDHAALSNDDTKIIRTMSERISLVIDPGFTAIYRPRTNWRAFVKHTFARGTTFVDGFAGVKVSTNLSVLGLSLAPLLGLAALVGLIALGQVALAALVLLCAFLVLCLPPIIAARNGCPTKGIRSYFAYALLFAVPYWAGVCRGVWIHRRALFTTSRATPAV